MSCDMLGTSKGSVADGAFVITSHLEEEEEEEDEKKMVVGQLKLQIARSLLLCPSNDVVVEQRAVWLC